jgi:hypothetical protein
MLRKWQIEQTGNNDLYTNMYKVDPILYALTRDTLKYGDPG